MFYTFQIRVKLKSIFVFLRNRRVVAKRYKQFAIYNKYFVSYINTLQIYNIFCNTQNIYYFCLKIFYMSLLKVVLHPDKIVKYSLNVKQAVVLDLILKQCDRNKAENIMGLTFFKISNDKLLEDITFLNIKKRMLIMIINELEKLDFIKKPRNQNRRMLLRFTNKAVEYFKS